MIHSNVQEPYQHNTTLSHLLTCKRRQRFHSTKRRIENSSCVQIWNTTFLNHKIEKRRRLGQALVPT
eukprot:c42866_g1_i1 orf=3-203(+)